MLWNGNTQKIQAGISGRILNRKPFLSPGKTTCLPGGNGSGKSTLLKLFAGLLKGGMGKIRTCSDKIAYLPQTVNIFFPADSVREETVFPGCDRSCRDYLTERLKLGRSARAASA